MTYRSQLGFWFGGLAVGVGLFFIASWASAVPMKEDPNGFEEIPWGTPLSESDPYGKVEDAGRLKTYELKNGAPTIL